MSRYLASLVSIVVLSGIPGLAQARGLLVPTIHEATDAIADMFSGTGMPRPAKVRLGTCIASDDALRPGQAACTVSMMLGAAFSENRFDFHKQGSKWTARPSTSRDKLPFPDPKLD